jgi:hypothetical protein
MTRARKRLLVALAALVLLLLGLCVTGFVAAEPIARSFAQRAARANGVDLEVAHVDFGWGWIRLRDAAFTLREVRGVRGTFDRATVDLAGLSPTRVELQGVSIEMVGSAADFVVDLGGWAKHYGHAIAFPVVAANVGVQWREAEGDAPWLEVDHALVAPRAGGAFLRADHAEVLGAQVGPVGAVWTTDLTTVTFGFGNEDPSSALVRMEIDQKASPGKAHLVLAPIKLGDLAKPLGVSLPIRGDVLLEGTADLSLSPRSSNTDIDGELHARLRGYVPPHPVELNGIVFGELTTFDTHVRLASDRKTVHLTDVRVGAGAFKLLGEGTVKRQGEYATIDMRMAGDIPCTALAASAAGAHLGNAMGRLVGDLAKLTVSGSVRVGATVHADTRDLAGAKVDQSVGVGCGLRLTQ